MGQLDITDPSLGYGGYTYSGMPTIAPKSPSNSGSFLPAIMAMSAIGALSSAYSQAQAIKAAGSYRESVARVNSRIANLQAAEAIAAGDLAASRRNVVTQQVTGAIRAQQGASGVSVGSGSAVLTRIGADFVGKMDELAIRNNAARQAWGYKVQALSDTYQGQFDSLTTKAQAEQTLLTGGLKAIEEPLSIYSRYPRAIARRGASGGEPFDLRT